MSETLERLSALSPEERKRFRELLRENLRRQARADRIERSSEPGPHPLSFAQQALWVLDRFHDGGAVYNVSRVFRLDGGLDARALARSLAEVARRHAVLRTRFEEGAEGPVQRIDPDRAPTLARVDLGRLPVEHREDAALAIAGRAHRGGFDLGRRPPVRWLLIRLDARRHLLVLTFHHVVFDGWSVRVLSEELSELYRALRAGRTPALPDLPVRYVDYARWQRGRLRGETLERELGFWRERLADAPRVLDLPTDRPRPTAGSSRGAVLAVRLPEEEAEGLERLGRRLGAGAFVVLLSVLATALSRFTGQDDLLLGEVVANRPRRELEALIGLFVNTLALRADLSADPTFAELVEQLRVTVGEATSHGEVPFERVVEAVGAERTPGRPPLCQVLVGHEGEASGGLDLDGLRVSPVDVAALAPATSRVDLTMVFRTRGGTLDGWIEYNTDLFDPTTIRRLWTSIRQVARQVADRPSIRPARLALLPPGARHQVLVEWNATRTRFPRGASLGELVARRAAETPDRVAVDGGEELLTYGGLLRKARLLADTLRAVGVGIETRVGLFLPPSPDLVVAMLAVAEAGGAYVPLDVHYPGERLAWMLRDAEVAVVLAGGESLRRIEEIAADLPAGASPRVVDAGADAGAGERARSDAPAPAARRAGPDHLAYVIYTSGSTGRPKGVMVTHAAVARLALGTDYLELAPDDRVGQAASTSFDATTFEVWGPLVTGARVCLLARESLLEPRRLAAELRRRRLTVLFLTTALVQQVVRELPDAFASLRVLLFGGEAVDAGRVRELLAAGPPDDLLHVYGPTESTTFATWQRTREVPRRATTVPIGMPLANTTVHVVDHRLAATPLGVPGELAIGGEGLARGYLDRAALTAERFVPDPTPGATGGRLYRTGDRVRRRGDGAIEFLGRYDDQVKVRGFRIELGEVEAALLERPEVAAAVVSAYRDAETGSSYLAAHVVPASGSAAALDPVRLRRELAARLPDPLVPAAFVALDSLPLNRNGKVDRRALPDPDAGRLRSARGLTAPGTPLERAVAKIWSAVLRLDRVGADDDFFDLGGNSLSATRVVSRVRSELEVELPLRAFFAAPTVAGLAASVSEARLSSAGLDLPPLLPTAAPPPDGDPLSYAQERLWFLHRMAPESASYTSGVALVLEGPLSVPALSASLAEIRRRHEPLRSRFRPVGGRPVARVHPVADRGLPVIDARRLDPGRADAELVRRLDGEERRHPFDLEAAPPIRALLFRRRDDEHVLVVRVHHIAFDGWSQAVFLRELAALYESISRGDSPDLPPLPVRYGDFAAWQRRWLRGDRLEGQLAFWRRRLEGLRTLDLPTDRPRPAVKGDRGSLLPVAFPAATTEALRSFARRQGVTDHSVLLALFQVFLTRLSGREDVAVGSPIANRTVVEVEPLIGCFANTLVLRSECPSGESFTEIVRRVHRGALDAFAHQDLPFERLVEALRPARDLSRNPLFQVLFSLHDAPDPRREVAGISMIPTSVGLASSPFDLSLWLREREGRIEGDLQYDVELFDPVTVERFRARLLRLAEAALAAPEHPVGELDLLGAAEAHQVRIEWNDTARRRDRAMVLPRLLERCVAARPDAVAVVCGDRALTYGALLARVDGLAARLARLGVGPETPVGVYLDRSVDMLVAVLAVMAAGGAYVPLDPSHPEARVRGILEDSGAVLLVTRADLSGAPSTGIPILDVDAPAPAPSAAGPPDERLPVRPESLAYIIYTSGSTGRPKGVQIAHGALAGFLAAMAEEPGLGSDDVLVALTTLGFDISNLELYLPLVVGGRVVIAPDVAGIDGRRLARLVEAERATAVQATPATWRLLLESGWSERPTMAGERGPAGRRLLCGGEALPRELADRLLARGVELWNLYGPTETTVWSATGRVGHGEPVTVGRPIADTELHVVGPALRPQPPEVPGELVIGGAGVARGYLGRPALTAERFVPDAIGRRRGGRLYRTGDLVRRHRDGRVTFLGRLDHQVKVRGFRIETGEIEARLLAHPGVREVVVTPVIPGRDGPDSVRLAAYLLPDGPAPAAGTLREHLREVLPEYMVPSFFVPLDALPLNPNGKVDRGALPAPEAPAPEAGFAAPAGELEPVIAEIWREVLGVPRVGAGTSFFDLGGHSLLMVRVHERLSETLDRELAIVDLFHYPTVRSLARFLDPSHDSASAGDRGRRRATVRRERRMQRRRSRRARGAG